MHVRCIDAELSSHPADIIPYQIDEDVEIKNKFSEWFVKFKKK